MKNTLTCFFIISFMSFCVGFLAAELYDVKLSKTTEATKSTQVEQSVATVSTQTNLKKDSTTVQQTIIVKKNYSNTGKLRSETITNINFGSTSSQLQNIAQKESTNKKVETDTKTFFLVKPNWEFGAMAPMLDYKKPVIDIGYRLFGDFYLHAEANVFDKTGSVGFFILF